jgi:hypothetical protein
MQSTSWRRVAAIVPALAVPVVFFGILLIWAKIDEFLGSREVSKYILEHQPVVTQRLENPKVHSFSLTHHPMQPGALLIEFDVDDKATYEILESDLDDIWGMRFPPQWETTVRSKERLSNNFGYAAWGIGELYEGLNRIAIAGIASLALAVFTAVLALRRARRPRPSE